MTQYTNVKIKFSEETLKKVENIKGMIPAKPRPDAKSRINVNGEEISVDIYNVLWGRVKKTIPHTEITSAIKTVDGEDFLLVGEQLTKVLNNGTKKKKKKEEKVKVESDEK